MTGDLWRNMMLFIELTSEFSEITMLPIENDGFILKSIMSKYLREKG